MDTLFVLAVTAAAVCSVMCYSPYVPASKLAPKCFECNYSPSASGGYKWQALSRAGYPSCALRHPTDSDKVDKYTCGSGVCFIREEQNGMIYRGCADPHVLPWGVTPAQQCKEQGPSNSLWWFCIGDLCNFGEHPCGLTPYQPDKSSASDVTSGNATSSSAPTSAPTTSATTAPPTTSSATTQENEEYKTLDAESGEEGYPETKQMPYEKTLSPASMYNMYQMMYPWNYYEYYGMNSGEMNETEEAVVAEGEQEQAMTEEVMEEYTETTVSMETEQMEQEEEEKSTEKSVDPNNPCDGECKDNPSGLFPHPQKMNYFIQCGFDHQNGHSCTCCKPFYRRCPPGTEFDDTTKVCTGSNSINGHYKQVYVKEEK